MRAGPILVVLAASSLAFPVRAELRPLWEVGAGVALLNLPNYRGSDERQIYALPMPYIVYRGDVLRVDREGLRGLIFDSERVEVNVSLNGSLPVSSDDDPLRRGMEDLDPTVEVGPTLNVRLWQAGDRKARLELRAPIRAAVTVNASPEHIGWLFSPNLLFKLRDPAGFTGWNLGVQAGPYYNDREYNAYFYRVAPNEATPARPAYSARGGYSGTQAMVTLTRRFPRYWVGGFVRYDTLHGAVIEDSPLVQRHDAISAGVALSWIFGESRRRVEAELDD